MCNKIRMHNILPTEINWTIVLDILFSRSVDTAEPAGPAHLQEIVGRGARSPAAAPLFLRKFCV